jgi:hypothetical protein
VSRGEIAGATDHPAKTQRLGSPATQPKGTPPKVFLHGSMDF